MATSYSIPTILTIAKISEYLAANEASKTKLFKSIFIDKQLAKVIYMERVAVQNRYNLDPTDTTLPLTSNYLFDLLGKYSAQAEAILQGQTQAPPIISDPSNQSVNVGDNATFTVSVISSLAYSIQWYKNGVAITGATSLSYTLTNAQLSDDTSTFYAKATNAAGSATSNSATLNVSALITVFAYYATNDPYPTLSLHLDNLAYQISQNISHNSNITITWPLAAATNQYQVLKVPVGESIKTLWFNTPLNQDPIPDANWQSPLTFGGFTYYCSRVAISISNVVLTTTFS